MTAADAEQAILTALTALNTERPPDDQLEISRETPILGADSRIDSLALVFLITDLEAALKDRHGVEVSLMSDEALQLEQSPFRNVSTLRDFIVMLAARA